MKWSVGAVGALVFAASVAACSGDEGAPGPGGTGSTTSSSSGASSSTGSSGDADAGPSARKPNGTVGCEQGTECESEVCFMGNMQHFCSVNCTLENATAVCKAPFTGTCNKQGFCKRD